MSTCNERDLLNVNNEIQSVYEYCIGLGLSHDEIVKKASPLLQPLNKEEWKTKLLVVLKISICCLALSFVLSNEPVSRVVSSGSRHVLFKLLPLWDWTQVYTASCLVSNPLYADQQVLFADCQACEDVHEIDHINRTSSEDISLTYLQPEIPVIILDGISNWPAMEDSFTIWNVTEGYHNIDDDVCMFQTNLRVSNHLEVLEKIMNDDSLVKWYAHWENCQKTSAKFLRKFYSRPYFMPDIIQMTESNWLLMSSNYMGKKFKSVEVSSPITIMWAAQVRGYNLIRLEPREPCHTMCNVLEDTIEEGEIVLFSPSLWSLSYLPGEEIENLAIMAGGFSQFL